MSKRHNKIGGLGGKFLPGTQDFISLPRYITLPDTENRQIKRVKGHYNIKVIRKSKKPFQFLTDLISNIKNIYKYFKRNVNEKN
jgi:hypothetical protein